MRTASVVLSGDLDLYQAAVVRERLDTLDGPGTIDMRDVRYLDSSTLVELARVARRVGVGSVRLVVGSRNVRKILDLVRFNELFVIVDVWPAQSGARETV